MGICLGELDNGLFISSEVYIFVWGVQVDIAVTEIVVLAKQYGGHLLII